MATTSGAIRAGRAFIEVFADSNALSQGLKQAQERISSFSDFVSTIGSSVSGLGTSIINPVIKASKYFEEYSNILLKMSLRTHVSVEALTELGFAAEQSDATIQDLSRSIYLMNSIIPRAAESGTVVANAFRRLGLTVKDLQDLNVEQRFIILAEAIKRVADASEKVNLSRTIFGRSSLNILALIERGAINIDQLRKQFRGLGLTVSTVDAQLGETLSNLIGLVTRVLKNLVYIVGASTADIFLDLGNKFISIAGSITKWANENRGLIKSITVGAAAVTSFGAVITGLGIGLFFVSQLFGVFANTASLLVGGLGAIISVVGALLSPLGLLGVALTVLAVKFVDFGEIGNAVINWLDSKLWPLVDTMRDVVYGMAAALSAGDVVLAAEVLWKGLQYVWAYGVAGIQSIWDSLWRGLVESALTTWYVFLEKLSDVWADLRLKFVDLIGFLQKKWEDLKASFQSLELQSAISQANAMIDSMERAGEISAEAAVRMRDSVTEQAADIARGVENSVKAAQDQITRDQELERTRIQSLSKAMAESLQEDLQAAIIGVEEGLGDAVDASKVALEEAKTKLSDALRRTSELVKTRTKESDGVDDSLKGVLSRIRQVGGVIDSTLHGITSQGGFVIGNLLGFQSNAADKLAGGIEEIAENTRNLRTIELLGFQ